MKSILGIASLALVLAASPAAAGPTATIDGGRTAVALAPEFAEALTALGVSAAPIDPSTSRNDRLRFPIPAGAVDLATLRGEILHTGGLTLAAGETLVELQNFIIDTQDAPVLTGLVTVNDDFVARLALFDLELTSAPVVDMMGRIVISDVNVTLTQGAADALNEVFAIDALVGGFPIGTARVVARPSIDEMQDDDDDDMQDGDDDDDDDDYRGKRSR